LRARFSASLSVDYLYGIDATVAIYNREPKRNWASGASEVTITRVELGCDQRKLEAGAPGGGRGKVDLSLQQRQLRGNMN